MTLIYMVSVTVPDGAKNYWNSEVGISRTVEKVIESNLPHAVAVHVRGASTNGPQAVSVRASEIKHIKDWIV
jgi:hypothetical protein